MTNSLTKIKLIKIENSAVKRLLYNFFNLITSEIFIWSSALIYLAIFNHPDHNHFTICPIKNLGIDFCPGCGLGNSISYLFHGDFISSFSAHPFGIPALIILVSRIISLIKQEGNKNAKRVTINA
jgi:hypothetical protein